MATNFWKKLNKPILALAPMAGITDSAFRQICRKYGAEVVYSEMASACALFFKPDKTLELVKFEKSERPYVVQLFGKYPAHFAKAAKIITEQIRPDGIDINFGCPAKKVFGHGSGCALMLNIKLAREIISAVCENTNLPVSLKIRAGVKNISAVKFINEINNLPFSAVMVHCRTYERGFSGTPDYSIAEKIKKIIPDKIVLVNGGINSAEVAVKILKKYKKIDGLGIARGAMGKPWIFNDIKEIINSKKLKLYDLNKIKKIAIKHAELLYKSKNKKNFFEIRKHLVWYFKGFPGVAEMRKKLVLVRSVDDIKKILLESV